MFKDRAKRIQMFADGTWDTGVQMAQLSVDGVHVVSYWDHSTERYSIMMIGGDSERVKKSFAAWVDQNPARLSRCTSPDTLLDAFYEFYRNARRAEQLAERF